MKLRDMPSASPRRPISRLASLFACALGLAACTDDSAGDDEGTLECTEIDYEGCAQLYPPTWDQVWQQTISTTCTGGGSACHEGDEGLRLLDQDGAYEGLTTGVHAVIAGDPQCSPLLIRLESEDPAIRMPPGSTTIPAGARCSIAAWIESGAPQN